MGHQPSSSICDRYTETERIELEANQQRVLEAPMVNQRGRHRRRRILLRNFWNLHRNFQQPTSRLRRRNRRQSREVIRERDGIPVIELSDSEEGVAAEATDQTNQAGDDRMIARLTDDEVMAVLTAEESDLVSSPSPCSSVGSNDPVYDEIDESATQSY